MSRSSGRFWLLLVVGFVLVALVVGGAGTDGPPLDPRSVNPDGARGVVEVLEELGASVEIGSAVPRGADTAALLLVDRLSNDDSVAVDRWIERGGTLVVADALSSFAPRVSGFAPRQAVTLGECDVAALAPAMSISGGGSLFRSVPGAQGCFGSDGRSYVVVAERGEGTVVSVGGAQMFTNAELSQLDNAFVAVALLAPNPDQAQISVLGPSTVAFGDEPINDLVPERVRNAIFQLLAAFLLYALFRVRRLGRVVREPLPVQIEGSELVLKAGVLSERAKDPSGTTAVIRDEFVRRWRRTLATDTTDTAQLSAMIADASGAARGGGHGGDAIVHALTGDIGDDADMLAALAVLDDVDGRTSQPNAEPVTEPIASMTGATTEAPLASVGAPDRTSLELKGNP